MTDETLLQNALSAWNADRGLTPAVLLPGDDAMQELLAAHIERVQKVERVAQAPPADASTVDGPTSPDDDVTGILGPRLRPGDIGSVAGYFVTSVLGRGGMGVVFAAEDAAGTRLAVKLILSNGFRPADNTVARFRRECHALRAITHPGVVPVVAVAEHRGLPALVMPRLDGETLENQLRQVGWYDPTVVERFAWAVAGALAAVHAAGYVHRDLKPSNIWLEPHRPRLIDFGLARQEGGHDLVTSTSGQLLGTPAYMSPEQADGEKVDGRADLWSLGVVLYRMTTGVLPFTGKSLLKVLQAVQTHHPPPPAAVRPTVPARLSELVMRLLAKSPADRLQTAAEVVAALRWGPEAVPPADAPDPAEAEVDHLLDLSRRALAAVRRLVAPPRLVSLRVDVRGRFVTADVLLDRPGHVHLFVFTADGRQRLAHPVADAPPRPRLSVHAIPATVPPGFTAVVAMASAGHGLPELLRRRAVFEWVGPDPLWQPTPAPAGRLWRVDRNGLTEERDGVARPLVAAGPPAAAVARLVDWFRRRPGVADAAAVGLVVG